MNEECPFHVPTLRVLVVNTVADFHNHHGHDYHDQAAPENSLFSAHVSYNRLVIQARWAILVRMKILSEKQF